MAHDSAKFAGPVLYRRAGHFAMWKEGFEARIGETSSYSVSRSAGIEEQM
jgi:hypothetical protein